MAGLPIKQKRRKRLSRNLSGQAIVENTAVLFLLIGVSIAMIFIMLDLGVSIFYQQKIILIATQVANAYSLQCNGWEYQNPGSTAFDADALAKSLAKSLGLPPAQVTASVSVIDSTKVLVTVRGADLPLVLGCPSLPGTLTIVEKLAATNALLPRPTCLLSVNVVGQPGGRAAGPNPTALLPAYSGIAQLDKVASRAQGDAQDPEIPGPGTYDQFSFSMTSPGANMDYTPGTRGMHP